MDYSKHEIVDLVRIGCVEAISAIQGMDASDPLIAFALCTDDDLAGVFHVGCTRRFESDSTVRGVRYLPCDWSQTGNVEPRSLTSVQRHLQRLWKEPPGEVWDTKRDESFEALVEGLAAASRELGITDTTFLAVMSTDPGEHMERLEEEAVLRLNHPAVVGQWLTWRLGETTSWLSEVLQKAPPLSWADEDLVNRLRQETTRLEALLEQNRHAG